MADIERICCFTDNCGSQVFGGFELRGEGIAAIQEFQVIL
jgi:hypothetical protein